MQPESNHKTTLAIIGGGRWGQVTLSVLLKMNLPIHHIIVTRTNHDEIKQQLGAIHSALGTFSVVGTILDLPLHSVDAAIVVNSAQQHFETAKILIDNGIHVLIEKPITLAVSEMRFLIEQSLQKLVVIVPGLSYRFCSYISNFALQLRKLKKNPSSFNLEWCDANNEIRYAQVKKHDQKITVAEDVMPHIWTILSTVFNDPNITIKRCDTTSNRNHAIFFVLIGKITGQIIVSRNAAARRRFLTVHFNSTEKMAIDFTNEPGVITHKNDSYTGDAAWKNADSPLMQQVKYFLSQCAIGKSVKNDLDDCMHSVSFAETASALLEKQIAAQINTIE